MTPGTRDIRLFAPVQHLFTPVFLAAHTAQTSCASCQHFQWRPPRRPRRPCRKRELAMTRRTRLHDCLARCTASSCRVPSRLTSCAASDASEHLVQSRWLRRVVAVPCCASSDSDACQEKISSGLFPTCPHHMSLLPPMATQME